MPQQSQLFTEDGTFTLLNGTSYNITVVGGGGGGGGGGKISTGYGGNGAIVKVDTSQITGKYFPVPDALWGHTLKISIGGGGQTILGTNGKSGGGGGGGGLTQVVSSDGGLSNKYLFIVAGGGGGSGSVGGSDGGSGGINANGDGGKGGYRGGGNGAVNGTGGNSSAPGLYGGNGGSSTKDSVNTDPNNYMNGEDRSGYGKQGAGCGGGSATVVPPFTIGRGGVTNGPNGGTHGGGQGGIDTSALTFLGGGGGGGYGGGMGGEWGGYPSDGYGGGGAGGSCVQIINNNNQFNVPQLVVQSGPSGPYGQGGYTQSGTNGCVLFEWDAPALSDSNFKQAIADWFSKNPTCVTSEVLTIHGPISRWDVSQVTTMNAAFKNRSSFNQNLSQWDVSAVKDMTHMFKGAKAFKQDLSSWATKFKQAPKMKGMFTSCGIHRNTWKNKFTALQLKNAGLTPRRYLS